MADIDLNLLSALDALLAEGSVTGAARRLGLSASAMSRTLARLREATGDPLLVRAGRGLVPTPRALELRERVHVLAQDVRTVLAPRDAALDPSTIARTFTIRANDGFVGLFGARLFAAVVDVAPQVRLRFAPKPDKQADPLREGRIDLEIGVLGEFAPEVRTQALFRDDFVGVVRVGHPLLEGDAITPERYAACRHIVSSRRGEVDGPVDRALAESGLARTVAMVVPGFAEAIRVASETDLVALVPRSATRAIDPGMQCFALPVRTPTITVSAMWHPRMGADPVHRWFRERVIATCRED